MRSNGLISAIENRTNSSHRRAPPTVPTSAKRTETRRMPRTAIVALGTHLPDRVVTNQELTRYMETSDEWIQQRTGIRERRWVGPDTGATDLAFEAAKKALDKAGWKPEDVEAIVYATL